MLPTENCCRFYDCDNIEAFLLYLIVRETFDFYSAIHDADTLENVDNGDQDEFGHAVQQREIILYARYGTLNTERHSEMFLRWFIFYFRLAPCIQCRLYAIQCCVE